MAPRRRVPPTGTAAIPRATTAGFTRSRCDDLLRAYTLVREVAQRASQGQRASPGLVPERRLHVRGLRSAAERGCEDAVEWHDCDLGLAGNAQLLNGGHDLVGVE